MDVDDVPIIMGDFNASLGKSTSDEDLVCGSYGSDYQNESGKRLKSFAGMHSFVDLVSWEEQELPATHYDIKTRAGREQGIQVARRTIAKYRESLNIPPSNERKSLI